MSKTKQQSSSPLKQDLNTAGKIILLAVLTFTDNASLGREPTTDLQAAAFTPPPLHITPATGQGEIAPAG